jgi:hypothetical protein
MLNESTYKEKISSLLEWGVYELLHKDPTSQSKHKSAFFTGLKHKLTSCHSNPPRLCSLTKTHEPNITPFTTGCPCCASAEFLHKILSLWQYWFLCQELRTLLKIMYFQNYWVFGLFPSSSRWPYCMIHAINNKPLTRLCVLFIQWNCYEF